jgi:predicted  nucleic acid-binding Zn-ribbon protein
MPTVDERLASLEAKVEAITDLRAVVLDMRAEMHQRFAQIDQRFAQIDQRFAQIDAKIDRNFVWATGMMLTGFISVIGALLSR